MAKSNKTDEPSGASVVGVAMIAAAAGAVAALLLAPKSGKETREDIKRQASRLRKQTDKGMEVAREAASEGKKELKAVAREAAHDAKELSTDAKVRAKRTVDHAKTGAGRVEARARKVWSGEK